METVKTLDELVETLSRIEARRDQGDVSTVLVAREAAERWRRLVRIFDATVGRLTSPANSARFLFNWHGVDFVEEPPVLDGRNEAPPKWSAMRETGRAIAYAEAVATTAAIDAVRAFARLSAAIATVEKSGGGRAEYLVVTQDQADECREGQRAMLAHHTGATLKPTTTTPPNGTRFVCRLLGVDVFEVIR